jgi:hypothetical protein
MAANRRRGRRIAALATTVAAVTLTAGLLTGCENTDDALDCLTNNNDTDDSKVDKAVDDLNKAIEDYNSSVLDGDTDPDSSRIDAAANELKDVCAS